MCVTIVSPLVKGQHKNTSSSRVSDGGVLTPVMSAQTFCHVCQGEKEQREERLVKEGKACQSPSQYVNSLDAPGWPFMHTDRKAKKNT